jgi:hypothetical protein
MTVQLHAGYVGAFTREEAEGALCNGTRVVKVWGEKGDAHPLGAEATVLGSMSHPDVGVGYFLEWDDMPRTAVFAAAKKVKQKE